MKREGEAAPWDGFKLTRCSSDYPESGLDYFPFPSSLITSLPSPSLPLLHHLDLFGHSAVPTSSRLISFISPSPPSLLFVTSLSNFPPPPLTVPPPLARSRLNNHYLAPAYQSSL